MEFKTNNQYERKISFIINSVYITIIGLIIYFFLKYGISLLSPFIIAFVISYFLKKPSKYISKKIKISQKLGAFLLVLIFYSTIGVFFAIVGIKLTSVFTRVISMLPSLYEVQFVPFLTATFNSLETTIFLLDPTLMEVLNEGFNQFISSLGTNITNISISLVTYISNIASLLPTFLIKILLMIISTFFMAMDFETISKFLTNQLSTRTNKLIFTIKEYIINTLFVVIRSYALIMSITFIELAIGFSIISIPNSILIAFIISIFDILPVLGTGGVMIPWTIITLFQGNYQTGFGLLFIYIFVTIIRNILEPKIVGKQLGLHPIITLVSMFIGASLIGVTGLFLFPIIVSLIKYLHNTGDINFIKGIDKGK